MIAQLGAISPGPIRLTSTWGMGSVPTLKILGSGGLSPHLAEPRLGRPCVPANAGNGVAPFEDPACGRTAEARQVGGKPSTLGVRLRSESAYANTVHNTFVARFIDGNSGLVYYGRRYYSAGQARFLGRDPIDEAGGPNLYGFVGNNPVNAWDYLGMNAFLVQIGWTDSGSAIWVEGDGMNGNDYRNAALVQASNTPGMSPLYNDWSDAFQAGMSALLGDRDLSSGSMVTTSGRTATFDVEIGPLLTEDDAAWTDSDFAARVAAVLAAGADNRLAAATPPGRMPAPTNPPPGPSLSRNQSVEKEPPIGN